MDEACSVETRKKRMEEIVEVRVSKFELLAPLVLNECRICGHVCVFASHNHWLCRP